MVFAELDRRARHAWTQRAKLLVQMLTTTAYGSLGVGLADPVLKGAAFGLGHLLALALGIVCGYPAYLLAPEGERNDA